MFPSVAIGFAVSSSRVHAVVSIRKQLGEEHKDYKQSLSILNKYKVERLTQSHAASRITRLWRALSAKSVTVEAFAPRRPVHLGAERGGGLRGRKDDEGAEHRPLLPILPVGRQGGAELLRRTPRSAAAALPLRLRENLQAPLEVLDERDFADLRTARHGAAGATLRRWFSA